MTPIEALQVLDTVTAQVSMDRKSHTRVIEAISVLQAVLKEKENGKNSD